MFDSLQPSNGLLKTIHTSVRSPLLVYSVSAALILAESMIVIAFPISVGALSEEVLGRETAALNTVALAILALVLANGAAGAIERYWFENVVTRIINRIHASMHHSTLVQPIAFQATVTPSDMIARSTQDLTELRYHLLVHVPTALRVSIVLIGSLLLMSSMSIKLTLAVVAMSLPVSLLTQSICKRLEEYCEQYLLLHANCTSQFQETQLGIKVLKAYGCERVWHRLFERKLAKIAQNRKQEAWVSSWFSFVTQGLGGLTLAIAFWLVAHELRTGGLSIAEGAALLVYTHILMQSVNQACANLTRLVQFRSVWRRIQTILDCPKEAYADRPTSVPVSPPRLDLKNIGFRYPCRSDHEVLSEINLQILPGERIAIVGASGSGKSTLCGLLLRFFSPTRGRILADGNDIESLPVDRVRQLFAYLPQEYFLFHLTIKNNILMDHTLLTDHEIPVENGLSKEVRVARRSAAKAGIEEFIEAQPNKFGEWIEEGGRNFSAGQRQRMALARAFARSAPILLLDEPTAALDVATEQEIENILFEQEHYQTIVTVTHRQSTAAKCDRVLFLERGRIVDVGHHKELSARCPAYRQLWGSLEQEMEVAQYA